MEKTYLFVPASRSDRIEKAIESNADAVIIDLEDAVAENQKNDVRIRLNQALKTYNLSDKPIYIRINILQSKHWQEDLDLVKRFPNMGVMVPKTESANDITIVEEKLSPNQKIIPLIETAKGIVEAPNIANSSRNIVRIAFGAVDYCLELGLTLTENENELIYPRSALVVASRAAGLPSPIDTVHTKLEDEEGLRKQTLRAKQLGLLAKLCIHPKQVDPVHQVLGVTPEELNWAKEVVEAFEKAESKGEAAVRVNGEMVDYPVFERAKGIVREIELLK